MEVLDLLDIRDAIISVDAMNAQKKIAKKIIECQADYLFCIKDNHKTLKQEIHAYFHKIQLDITHLINVYQETDSGHGRIEIRHCQTLAIDHWIMGLKEWESVKTVILLERIREDKKTGKREIEQHVYMSSLSNDAQEIATLIRQHWGIENKVHWLLDVVYREDNCRIRKGDDAENIAVMRRF